MALSAKARQRRAKGMRNRPHSLPAPGRPSSETAFVASLEKPRARGTPGPRRPRSLERDIEFVLTSIVTTKLPVPRRSARSVYRFAPRGPPVDLPFRRLRTYPPLRGFSAAMRRWLRRSGPSFGRSIPLCSLPIAPYAPVARGWRAGTEGLGPLVGLLRRISDTPTSHRSPPQHLTTLIKRPSSMGRDGVYINLYVD
jgi:hypothetical protein